MIPMSETAIKDALKMLSAGKRTLKSIDKILRSNRARADVAKEGYTAVNDRWNQRHRKNHRDRQDEMGG
jgi:hypothetical protein